MASEPVEIKIDVTSDNICPFCFIGKRKLDRAIELAKERDLNVRISQQWHPFLLDPTLKPDSARDKREHYANKFGKERFTQMEKMMIARGKLVGIKFSYGGKLSQTTDSHRLLEYAYKKGGEKMQLELLEYFFNGYFEREQDIGSIAFLAAQAVRAKLFATEAEAKEWLAGDEDLLVVQRKIREAQAMGITGVPFFVINGKYAISGAEDSELFVQVFEKLAERQSVI